MGAQSLRGMIDGQLSLDEDDLLAWHLTKNHFPPLPTLLISACKKAILRAADAEWDARVRLPRGYRATDTGGRTIRVADLVEMCHLHDLVEQRMAEIAGPDDED